jgi:2-phosphoglycerate kinase
MSKGFGDGADMQDTHTRRPWEVVLLGGASGAGKTSLSYRLARHWGVALTEVDDWQIVLECLTTPEQQPVLHFWRTHPAPHTVPPATIVAHLIALGTMFLPALAAVIVNHVETHTPLVLEGDFILPAVLAHPTVASLYDAGQVRAVFVHEPEEAQFLRNFLHREPEAGPQSLRAQVSWQYGQWLKQEAERSHMPVLLARPWATAFDRLLALCL